jgi:regulatory protein
MDKRITALKAQKRNHQRVNVYLDGKFAFGLSRIVATWLQVGQELSDEKIAELKEEDDIEVAYQRAIRFIGYRMRSISEVQQQLDKQDYPESTKDMVIDRLQRNGLLDDMSFAQLWVENRNEFRPRAHRMLAIELKQKGIDSDIISQILEETATDEELAYTAARKQVRKYRQLEWQEFRRKLGSFLARRGFSYPTIEPVVNQVWADIESENQISSPNTKII